MKAILTALCTFVSFSVFAGVTAYSGPSGEKLFVEAAPSLGKDIFLLKFEGPSSPWAGKVIQAKRTTDAHGEDRFSFGYDLELSTGVQKRTYTLVTDGGFELIEGSRVKKVELYYEGMPDRRKGLKLNQDRKLTEASQKVNLLAQHKKSPFKPEVD